MSLAKRIVPESHVVDILGSTKGRDQPIMLVEKALHLVECVDVETLSDPNTIFIDPFCKAGEVLLAMAMRTCLANEKQPPKLVSTDKIAAELYGGRYFGLAPDERHYRLSMRTFYGNDRSHDSNSTVHIRNGDYLSETDGRLNEQQYKKEFKAMIEFIKKQKPKSRIVAIGNPPYQESDGGGDGSSASPIYNFFAEQLIDSGQIDEFALVIPARWFSGGRNLDEFREKLVTSKQVKTIQYFERAEDVFPTVHVQGGVCFLHWSRAYKGNTQFIAQGKSDDIDLSAFDIIPDDPECHSIIKKISEAIKTKSVADVAWSGKPFGLRTFYFKRNQQIKPDHPNSVGCYAQGRKINFLMRSEITTNADKIDKWKVAVPATYATGARRCTLPKHGFFLVKKGEVVTETYNIVGCFNSKTEAESFINYLQSDFARYLLGLRKLTGRVTKDRWAWVPFMNTNEEWSDEKLFNHFNLTNAERAHIKRKVQEW